MNNNKNLIAKHFGLRGVAVLEGGKGLVGLALGVWLVSLRHRDLETVAAHLLYFLHRPAPEPRWPYRPHDHARSGPDKP